MNRVLRSAKVFIIIFSSSAILFWSISLVLSLISDNNDLPVIFMAFSSAIFPSIATFKMTTND